MRHGKGSLSLMELLNAHVHRRDSHDTKKKPKVDRKSVREATRGDSKVLIRRHAPFPPYDAPRFRHMSEFNAPEAIRMHV